MQSFLQARANAEEDRQQREALQQSKQRGFGPAAPAANRPPSDLLSSQPALPAAVSGSWSMQPLKPVWKQAWCNCSRITQLARGPKV